MPPKPMPGPTAAILIIGDEILSGKVDEQNARFLTGELRELGISLRRVEVIPDAVDEIAPSIRTLCGRFDYLFTSGGVGPTHDDVTMAGVAAAFGMRVIRRAELEPLVRTWLGADFTDRDLRMADVPEGARLLHGDPEVPGRWPVVAVNNVFILPGVPSIFRRKFELLRPSLRAAPFHSRVIWVKDPEGMIAGALDAVVDMYADVAVGSYPQLDAADHKVKVTLDGRDSARVDAAQMRLCRLLGDAVVRIA